MDATPQTIESQAPFHFAARAEAAADANGVPSLRDRSQEIASIHQKRSRHTATGTSVAAPSVFGERRRGRWMIVAQRCRLALTPDSE
jgi:hypothetical protein